MSVEFPSLNTSRLILRPLNTDDSLVLYQIYQSEGVLKYFPNPVPPTLEKIERFISQQQAHWERHRYGNWGVLTGEKASIIGWAGLQYLPELGETEVGFLFDRPYWGKGYATEAALASLQYGFEQVHLDYLIALVHPGNLASRRVLEKCGMAYIDSVSLWGLGLWRYRIDRSGRNFNIPVD